MQYYYKIKVNEKCFNSDLPSMERKLIINGQYRVNTYKELSWTSNICILNAETSPVSNETSAYDVHITLAQEPWNFYSIVDKSDYMARRKIHR